MAAGQGFKTFTTGEVLTAGDVNGYLMQGINVFASSSARSAAIISPQEGQYSYLKDTNALEYYDGSAWVGAPVGDITAVTAGKGLTGGGSSGDVTVSLATTAKGDLVAGSGASTAAVLTVGNNGETLVADSSTATGLRYQAPVNSNPVLNSAFQVWQRGTTFTNTNGYTADRWYKGGNTPHTFSRQATNDTTNLPFIQYCLRAQRDSGSSATGIMQLANMFETVNSIPYAGKTVTFSFYARAGANYSPTSSALSAQVRTGTGTDQNLFSGYTGSATPITISATLTTTWQRFQGTATLASTATEMCVYFECTPTGTAGANDYYEVTGVQIEVGSVATPFKTYAGTIQGELAACQRYYYRAQDTTTLFAPMANAGMSSSTTNSDFYVTLPVSMRTKPSSVDFSTLRTYDYVAGAGYAVSAITLGSTSQPAMVLISCTMATATAGRFVILGANNSTSAFLGFSAEL